MTQFASDTMRSIDNMLNPSSVAVVGATERLQYGGRFLRSIMPAKDKVRIYPVNPKYDKVLGMRCYPTVLDLPEVPDLVSVIVPQDHVMQVLEESAQIGVKAAIVISAGFSERGDLSRKQAQQELKDFSKRTGLRICGPNCLGVANVAAGIWATASQLPEDNDSNAPSIGPVALVSHSGATAFGPIMIRAKEIGLGFSHIISTGNEVDLESSDFIAYLLEDPDVKVVACFIEGFKDGRKLISVAERALELDKRIVLIKVGRSEVGSKAALSHTAAMTGSDSVHNAAFKQFGIIRSNEWDELLHTADLLAHNSAPSESGVVLVSHSGGVSSMIADHLGQADIPLPPLTSDTQVKISNLLGGFGWSANPADITVFANRPQFGEILRLLETEPQAGAMVIATFGNHNQVEQIKSLKTESTKPILFVTTGSNQITDELSTFKDVHIPVFHSSQMMANSLSGLFEYGRKQRSFTKMLERTSTELPSNRVPDIQGPTLNKRHLNQLEVKRFLTEWGVPCAIEEKASNTAEAIAIARKIGFPVAVKIDSADIPHKTEAGAVLLNLSTDKEVAKAYLEVKTNGERYAPNSAGSPVVVQEMVSGIVETLIGVSHDPQFGPVIAFGIGGIFVELFDDLALRICPITEVDALEMIEEIRGYKLLTGFRGSQQADIESIVSTLVAVSTMAAKLSDKAIDLDINPLMVLPNNQGVKAVDVLLRFGH